MLIKTDSTQAPIKQRDLIEFSRHQSATDEAAHEARESAPLAPDAAGMDVTDPEQRMGRPMSAWMFQQRLQKIRPFLVFERSNADPTITGVYIEAASYDPALYKGRLIHVCGMDSGMVDGHPRMIPEFSITQSVM